jgi:hypothetical protein
MKVHVIGRLGAVPKRTLLCHDPQGRIMVALLDILCPGVIGIIDQI